MNSIHRSIVVRASPKAVWALIAKYDEASWHPLVTEVSVLSEGPTGIGSVRACRFDGGMTQKERIVEFRENEAFSIELYDMDAPIVRARSDWTLRPEGAGTRVDIKVSFEPAPGAPIAEVEAALREHVRIALDGFAATAEGRVAPKAV